MELEQIKEKKKQAEDAIRDIILNFRDETGVNIMSLTTDINKVSHLNNGEWIVTHLDIKIIAEV